VHRNLRACPETFLKAVERYRHDLVVAVECIFSWYWLADLCAQQGIEFVLGHALYRKAIHGGKAKNDRIDSQKIVVLLRGGMIPVAYVYPTEMRSTRDPLRRRTYLMRKRAELLVHVQNTNSQYNLPEISKKIAYRANRSGVAQRFSDPAFGSRPKTSSSESPTGTAASSSLFSLVPSVATSLNAAPAGAQPLPKVVPGSPIWLRRRQHVLTLHDRYLGACQKWSF
jgi:hypothetical protein